ncbi:MAG TPA: cysteine hydrolase [Candidatus Bathyarchaeota archaeon]|nr:cysteine hydrolase [Candidatus Bathyarchaeota archaeon]
MPKYAVLVVDMLEDFIHGNLKCERAERIIQPLKTLLDAARRYGFPVVYCNDAHRPDIDAEFELWGPHAIDGTPGSQVIEELKPEEGDFIVKKRRYSGFFQTDLHLLLRELGVDTVIVTGLHTNICVKHTTSDAFNWGFKIIIPKDCVEAFSEEDHKWGLSYMEKVYGAKITESAEVISLFRNLATRTRNNLS